MSNERSSSRPWAMLPRPVWSFVLRVLGLVAACCLGLLAFAALTLPGTDAHDSESRAAMIFAAPAIYLAAWNFLTLRSLVLAAVGTLITTILCIATFLAAFIFGFVSLGLLALPTGMVGVAIISIVTRHLMQLDAGEGATTASWGLHFIPLLMAMFGVLYASMGPGLRFDPSAGDGMGRVALMIAIFLPHATATQLYVPYGARDVRPPWRIVAVIAFAWALPAAAFFHLRPDAKALAWPLRVAALQAERQAELDLFRSVGARTPGFHAGESFVVRIGDLSVRATIPPGWLGLRTPDPPGLASPFTALPQAALHMAPDPRLATSETALIRGVTLRQPPSLMVVEPADGAPRSGPSTRATEFGCTEPETRWGGLIACRIAVPRQGTTAGQMPALVPDAAITRRVFLTWASDSEVHLFGAQVIGRCMLGAESRCSFWFPVESGLGLLVQVPLAEVHRWREARALAAAAIQSAVGLRLEDAPMLRQPAGEVLPLPR